MALKNLHDIKSEIISIFDRYLGGEYILIAFGSVARGGIDKASDIDLAIYSKKDIPVETTAEMREELNEKVHTLREIDLINLTDENINIELVKNILDEGDIWRKPRNSEGLLKNLKRRLTGIKK